MMNRLILRNKKKPKIFDAINNYLSEKEDVFDWQILDSTQKRGVTYVEAYITTLNWKQELWKHFAIIMIPPTVNYSDVYMVIEQGVSVNGEPEIINNSHPIYGTFINALIDYSNLTGTISVLMRNIPDIPSLGITNEDEFVFYCLDKYSDTRDLSWNPFAPMMKSTMNGFTAIQEICSNEGVEVNTYTLSGLSKRGWTTYLTGAYDSRVKSLIPVVIDYVNIPKGYGRRIDIYGENSPKPLQDALFYEIGTIEGNLKPFGREVLKAMDPFELKEYLQKPIYVISGTNDTNFAIDNAKFYVDDFAQMKLAYQKNAGHTYEPEYLYSSFCFHLFQNTNTDLPELTCVETIENGQLKLSVSATHDFLSINVIKATNDTQNFSEANWSTSSLGVSNKNFSHSENLPATGYKTVYLEFTFENGTGVDLLGLFKFKVCTKAIMVDNVKII